MRIGTIDLDQLKGVNEKVVGLGKEMVGVLVGNDRLQQEGSVQQEKASQSLKALRKQVEAEKSELKAEALERKQHAVQLAKEQQS